MTSCWNHCGYCQAFTFSSFYDSITFWKFLAPFIQNVYPGAGEEKKTMKICRKSSKIVSGFLRNTMYAYSKYVPQAWIKLILYTLKMPAMSVISSIFHKCSGLPKAEIFGRNRIFSLFGFRFRPPKFYSRYSAFGFVLKMSWYTYPFLIKACENLPKL